MIFDVLLISMCMALAGQLNQIASAYKMLKLNEDTYGTHDGKSYSSPDRVVQEFKSIISDQARVLIEMSSFYKIVRPIVLTQIAIASNTLVFLTFVMTLIARSGEQADFLQTFKIFSAIPMFLFQLFLTCYFFGNINKYKDSINFALYSSNWTDSNIDVKRLIVLTMAMNNAHQLKIKVTPNKIVNMEIFANVIHMCYSVLSVLIKKNGISSI
ncbi:odorant receptor 94a-like [Adelges cooleyi]|uniref:odorant receptor 94a-like n=1 Tax=Adelges cooleyi TaxID=133065 RepID=UPI00217FBF88|nr:odorant receptor 94a-like [Adelges cooleyi]